jgi:hypothetical protein
MLQDTFSMMNGLISQVENGENVDLEAMKNKIADLCGNIGGLEPEISRLYKSDLENLATLLDKLSKAMNLQQEQLQSKISLLNKSKLANRAYKKASVGNKLNKPQDNA